MTNRVSSRLTNITIKPSHFALFVIFFSLFGLLCIFDASVADSLQTFGVPWYYASRHAIWVGLGTFIFLILGLIPITSWQKTAKVIFLVAIILLVAVLIPGVGTRLQGAQRWILLGPVPIQPAEIAKLAVVIFFASWLSRHQRFLPFLVFSSALAGLVLLQPNMSNAVIIFLLATSMYFLAGGNWKPLATFMAFASILGLLLIAAVPYRRERAMTFLDPTSDPLGSSYHIRQITIALGRGGLFGQGIGLSKQKQHYLPETANDSVFAVLAEEAGFVGSIMIIGLYMLLINSGLSIAKVQDDKFKYLIAIGITTWLTLQIMLNLSAMVALVPLTGVPLPLLSYGGSAYLSNMIGLGILYRLLIETTKPKSRSSRGSRSRLIKRF